MKTAAYNITLAILFLFSIVSSTQAQDKYFGSYNPRSSYGGAEFGEGKLFNAIIIQSYWHAVGSGQPYNQSDLDSRFNFAEQKKLFSRLHVLWYPSYTPTWITTANFKSELYDRITQFFQRYGDRIDVAEVLNEVGSGRRPDLEPFLLEPGQTDVSGYDWALNLYKFARAEADKVNPNIKLALCDGLPLGSKIGTDNNVKIINTINKAAGGPYINSMGCQGHGLETATGDEIKADLTDFQARTGVDLYIAEYECNIADDQEQLRVIMDQVPVMYEHPHMTHFTFWGFEENYMWDAKRFAHLMRADGSDRPAMTWIRAYMNSKNAAPVTSFKFPKDKFMPFGSNVVQIQANDLDGVTKVDLYLNDVLVGSKSKTYAMYGYGVHDFLLSNLEDGDYRLKAIAYDSKGLSTTIEKVVTVSPEMPSRPADLIIEAEADAYVRGGDYSNRNYGTDQTLEIRDSEGNFARESFVRFNLGSIAQNIDSAWLELTASSVASGPGTVPVSFVSDDTWTESTLTHNTRPAAAPDPLAFMRDIASTGAIKSYLGPKVQEERLNDGKISIKLEGITFDRSIIFHSRENADQNLRPKLHIYLADGYKLKVVGGSGDGYYSQGEVVTIKGDAPPPLQSFAVWTGDVGAIADRYSATTTLTMPAANTTLTATYVDAGVRYEAEAAAITKGNVLDASGASGGKIVDGIGGFILSWTIAAPAGPRSMEFHVQGSGMRKMGVFLNNEKIDVVSADSSSYLTHKVIVNLVEGINLIELRDSEGTSELNVDYLDVLPVVSPVPTPTGLTAIGGDTTVVLNWDDSNDPEFDRFKVWRSVTQGVNYSVIASNVSASTYTDNDVTGGLAYYYKVSQVDINGAESAKSTEASATPTGTPVLPVPVPSGLTASSGNATVVLDWDDSGDTEFDSFKVWRSVTPGANYSVIASDVLASTYTDNGVNNGVVYYYKVSQMDTNGDESAMSGEVSATPALPPTEVVLLEYKWDWRGALTSSDAPTYVDPVVSAATDMLFAFSGDGGVTNGYNDKWSNSAADNALYLNRSTNALHGWGAPSVTPAAPMSFTIAAGEGYDVTVQSITLFVGSDNGQNGGTADNPGTYTATVWFGSGNTAASDYGTGVLFDAPGGETQTVSLASPFVVSAGTAHIFYIDLDTSDNNSSHIIDNIQINGSATAISPTVTFNAWIGGYPSLTGVNATPDGHGDAGHHDNFFEYASGGNPTDASDDRLLDPVMTVEEESGNMIMTYQYRRRKDHASVGLIYTVYHGTDLTNWDSTGVSVAGTADIQGKNDYELVTVEISIPAGLPERAQHFAYLKVEQR